MGNEVPPLTSTPSRKSIHLGAPASLRTPLALSRRSAPLGAPGTRPSPASQVLRLALPTRSHSRAAKASTAFHLCFCVPGFPPPPGPYSKSAAPGAHTPPPSRANVGQRLTAAPLPQAAQNVNLHTPPPCRPPPVPVPLPPPPASQWASGSLGRHRLLSMQLALVSRYPRVPASVQSLLRSPYLKGISHDCN